MLIAAFEGGFSSSGPVDRRVTSKSRCQVLQQRAEKLPRSGIDFRERGERATKRARTNDESARKGKVSWEVNPRNFSQNNSRISYEGTAAVTLVAGRPRSQDGVPCGRLKE